jgi:hypothetical protein
MLHLKGSETNNVPIRPSCNTLFQLSFAVKRRWEIWQNYEVWVKWAEMDQNRTCHKASRRTFVVFAHAELKLTCTVGHPWTILSPWSASNDLVTITSVFTCSWRMRHYLVTNTDWVTFLVASAFLRNGRIVFSLIYVRKMASWFVYRYFIDFTGYAASTEMMIMYDEDMLKSSRGLF